jgi:HlyD family secretion protein
MRTLVKVVLILAVLGGLGYWGFTRGQQWLAERNRPRYRTAALEMGDLRLSVNASGEVNPVLSVKIGSFVSGPISKLYVDFNEEVTKGQLLAEIDTQIYDAAVARDQAALAVRAADVVRVQAELQRAVNDEKRSQDLKEQNPDFISQTELDQYRYARLALEAQVKVAEAGVAQAQANLENSLANIGYTKILSPVDGIVIDRKIDPGQTLAAQFQTPELFVVAPDLRKKVHIFASVDEADIGLIRTAKEQNQPVFFTVDAYPTEVFKKGFIEQIRLSSKVTQNVVTYPVIVATENPDLKLLPGMTAMITFQISELKNVLKIPNSALRYYPDKEHVRLQDQKLLELNLTPEADDGRATSSQEPPVDDAARAAEAATRRIVWVQETAAEAAAAKAIESEKNSADSATATAAGASGGQQATDQPMPVSASKVSASSTAGFSGKLRGVEVMVGESDYQFTHVIRSELKSGDVVVVGIKPPEAP